MDSYIKALLISDIKMTYTFEKFDLESLNIVVDELDIFLVDVSRNFLVYPFAPIVELTVVVNVSRPLQLQVFFKFFSFDVKTLQ